MAEHDLKAAVLDSESPAVMALIWVLLVTLDEEHDAQVQATCPDVPSVVDPADAEQLFEVCWQLTDPVLRRCMVMQYISIAGRADEAEQVWCSQTERLCADPTAEPAVAAAPLLMRFSDGAWQVAALRPELPQPGWPPVWTRAQLVGGGGVRGCDLWGHLLLTSHRPGQKLSPF